MPRLLIVSNRLPVTVKSDDGAPAVTPSAGGLATGMSGPHERLGGLWIGWPGDLTGLSGDARAEVDRRLSELRLAPVALSADEVARYYEGYSNAVLWPLFHYSVARLPQEVRDFESYDAVNVRFADAVAERYEPGDLVWVHDYQLMLVPQLLRERVPDARIGFFLHIPFPSSEIFRMLPQRERILEGLLGADLVGFHTATYVRHFVSAALRLLGAATEVDRIAWRSREVRLGVFPMGVDAAQLGEIAQDPEIRAVAHAHRAPGEQLLVGVDRLDYSKGIPRRLLAFEAMLLAHPELRERVRLVQVAVPSRENVEAYREYRDEVDALVGRIHGEFATPSWSPIHYLYRGLSQAEIVALYRAADAVLVTPLRDGMNLVAKEFVASRPDGDGVLVLSEFAGAAAELAEALLVNPYDVQHTAATFHRALTMPEEERRTRMAALRERVLRYDVHGWARSFVARLERVGAPGEALAPSSPQAVRAAIDRARAAPRLALLLDYDGTLVPFAPTPELAAPDAALLDLLRRLAARPRTQVDVVSGRPRATLQRWLGALPIGLHAEHGFWSRTPGGEWVGAEVPVVAWREPVIAILREFAERTPGSVVEEKTAGVAWHYRSADPEYGAAQAKELSLHLQTLLSNVPIEILQGDKVIEVRPHGIHKGRAVVAAVARAGEGALFLALGDDRTDEDLFAALPPGNIAIHVGPAPSRAQLRILDVRAARALLEEIAASR
ncbi:MAG TPA: bifunctional alpha,alpha-trehalose-phosphate synthase (UDP-forming)/trehalose-phosphatase [Anaeromyxobacter sp.]|nr:bifunctional alpha,alpha-trehalose-phosphate synthase (UDP-forming)/trehalose-phosphatase [Anaeromyxobacter sp.]